MSLRSLRKPLVLALLVLLASGAFVLSVLFGPPFQWSLAAALLVAATCMAELSPVRLGRSHDITVSTTFGLASTLLHGPLLGMVAFGSAAIISDLVARKTWWKPMLNASIYLVPAACASLTVVALAGRSTVISDPMGLGDVGLIAVASTVFVVMNAVLVFGFFRLVEGAPMFVALVQDLRSQLAANAMVIGAVPVVMLVANHGAPLTPLLLLPIAVARRNLQIASESAHQALHDPLTALPNRLQLNHFISDRIAAHLGGVLFLIDLDGFNRVNDALGLSTGDAVLKLVADRLRPLGSVVGVAPSPSDGLVARIAGDEFAVMASPCDPLGTAARIRDLFAVPFDVGGIRLELQASIGAATVEDGHANAAVRRAEIARFSAKKLDDRIAVYCESMEKADPERLGLLADLRLAIERSEIDVHFQPKLCAESGDAISCEALARWNHPRLGAIRPDSFIPLAEESGLVRELTYYVLERSIVACRSWKDRGHDLSVAINVSPRTLLDSAFPRRVGEMARRYGLDPRSLIIEITEGTIMVEPERAVVALQELVAVGVAISLDDYGTGYSSLSMLASLPLTELKIDKSFITRMSPGSTHELITASTVDMAHRLGLRVVAEGVETAEVWSMLQSIGCDVGQGYLFCRPSSNDDFTRWLDEQSAAKRSVLARRSSLERPVVAA